MLAHWGAVPVKISIGNHFLENTRDFHKIIKVLVLNLCEISCFQYCTGNFLGTAMRPTLVSMAKVKDLGGGVEIKGGGVGVPKLTGSRCTTATASKLHLSGGSAKEQS